MRSSCTHLSFNLSYPLGNPHDWCTRVIHQYHLRQQEMNPNPQLKMCKILNLTCRFIRGPLLRVATVTSVFSGGFWHPPRCGVKTSRRTLLIQPFQKWVFDGFIHGLNHCNDIVAAPKGRMTWAKNKLKLTRTVTNDTLPQNIAFMRGFIFAVFFWKDNHFRLKFESRHLSIPAPQIFISGHDVWQRHDIPSRSGLG